MSELHEVRFGDTPIRFRVERSPRRRTVGLLVDAEDGLLVKAPEDADNATLSALVLKKGAWVLERQRRFAELPPKRPTREFVSGEALRYLGRQYRLRVRTEGDSPTVVRAQGGVLLTQVASGLSAEAQATRVKEGLERWYRARAEALLPERVQRYARRLGIPSPPVLIRGPEKRWGSCSPAGELRFNWRLMMGPMSLVDYVVAHELCHLSVPDHSPSFYRRLHALMPDHAAREARLRLEGRDFTL